MSGIESAPRSHIYIAGSYYGLDHRNEKKKPAWKLGHAYCLIDRFICAPDAYDAKDPKGGFFPKVAWQWVRYGKNVEAEILSNYKEKLTAPRADFPIGFTETVIGVDFQELEGFITTKIGQPSFEISNSDLPALTEIRKIFHEGATPCSDMIGSVLTLLRKFKMPSIKP
jgi:hypothetical protein